MSKMGLSYCAHAVRTYCNVLSMLQYTALIRRYFAGEYVLTSVQGCFKVPDASAEAVVLTLSGLTANVALQVALLFPNLLPRVATLLGRVCSALLGLCDF